MSNIEIIKGSFDTQLELQDASVVAGFPSPADDYTRWIPFPCGRLYA